jgi:large subunit ribosomal protein L24
LYKCYILTITPKVEVLNGKEKGKQGTVKKVLRKTNRVIVEGVNLVKKHVKSTEEFKGGIFTKEASLHYSQIALLDPTLKYVIL